MMKLSVILACAALGIFAAAAAPAQEATPTVPQKCSAIAPRNFPSAPPAAATKQGRFAACMPAKQCAATEDKAKTALGTSFCAMNNFDACRGGTCDKATLACMPEFRDGGSKGIKLSNCVSRPSKITCPKDGDEICLCDVEIEAKGGIQCGCACQVAPTATPTAR
jgi:hypothetical protein